MKKNKFLLLGLLVLPLLSACSGQTVIKPKRSYPGDPVEEKEKFEEYNMTVNVYLDFSHSETPIFSDRWYMLQPLSEEIKNAAYKAIEDNKDKADPLYPDFLCFSEYSSSIDDTNAWNFETSYKQGNILNLYGIWVHKEAKA